MNGSRILASIAGRFAWGCLWLLLVCPATVKGQFTFATNNGAITITKYTGAGGGVTIPSSTNGYPVKSIGNMAFNSCQTVTSVTIPSSVTNIGQYAFNNCSKITSVTIGSGVTRIGDYAFQFCTSLTGVTIPISVTNIGVCPFGGCTLLGSIYVSPGNPAYSSSGLVLFNNNQTRLVQFPSGYARLMGPDYTIPNTVRTISDWAFEFSDLLKSVTIPDSVTNLGDYTFYGCSSLNGLTIGNGVSRIGTETFAACSALTNITIPSSVTSIGVQSFFQCTGLTNVTLSSNLATIGDQAFTFCGLTSVTLPKSVISMGNSAFGQCFNLAAINVVSENTVFSSVNGVLFNSDHTTLLQYPAGQAASYVIPDSTKNIGQSAFFNCNNLTNVLIPNSVTNIGSGAFAACNGLTIVTIPSSIITIGSSAFKSCYGLTNVFFAGNAPSVNSSGLIISGSVDTSVFQADAGTVYYIPGTSGWDSTYGGLPTAGWYQPQPQIMGSGFGLGVQNNKFQFTISWATNTSVVIQASTNLVTWTSLATNSLINGTNAFSDTKWTNYSRRFYRVSLP